MRKGVSGNTTKTTRLNKKEIKKQLIESFINSKKVETEELNAQAEKVENSEHAATIIKEYEEIIHTKKKDIISLVYHQGKVFKKFKKEEKFIMLVKQFKAHKTMMIFKIS